MYDAVHVFAESIASLSESVDLNFVNLSCDDPRDVPWADGEIVQNYLNAVKNQKAVDDSLFVFLHRLSWL